MKETTLTDSHGKTIVISNINDIFKNFNYMQSQEPQIAVLDIPGFGILTFGVSKEIGFVEYMPKNLEPPYLYANRELLGFTGNFIEFDSGGTITPVPENQCIPINLVIKIIVDAFEKRKLPDFIDWYEE